MCICLSIFFLSLDGGTSENEDNDDDEDGDTCPGCHYEKRQDGDGNGCQCTVILENVTKLNGVLWELDLIDEIVNPAVVKALYEQVRLCFIYFFTGSRTSLKADTIGAKKFLSGL